MKSFDILLKLRELQKNANRKYFNSGIFPSYRKNILIGRKIPDDNIFFSASIVYILETLTPYFSDRELDIFNEIKKSLAPNFKNHSNKPERNSYNFWRKEERKHFPNGPIFSKLSKFALPDDIDTTSLVQLCNKPSLNCALKTKNTIPQHANNQKLQIKNGHKELKELKAYSTWFGNNMPIEFDVCVLSNLLLWINEYNFNFNQHDVDTVKLLKTTITNSLYFKSTFKSSPEYPNSAIILYHLSRVAAKTNYLEDCKDKIIDDILKLKTRTKNEFQILILNTSLAKLGSKHFKTDINILSPNISNHWWFTAGLLSVYGNYIIQEIAPWSIFHFRFFCPAFNLCLFLENKLITNTKD